MTDVLYYPTMEFRDELWVKKALLYWDRVRRIVPQRYTPSDSDFIKELKDNGLIKDIPVSESTQIELASQFQRFVDNRTAAGLSFSADTEDEHKYRIHHDKVYVTLWNQWKTLGKVEGDWAYLPREAIEYYMLFCAVKIAENRKIPIATDIDSYFSVSPYFIENGNIDDMVYNEDAKSFFCNLVLDNIFPAEYEDYSVRRLTEICMNRREEKAILRNNIDSLLKKLGEITDPEQLLEELEDAIKEIGIAKEQYKKSLDAESRTNLWRALAVGLPTAIGAASIAGLASFNPIAIGMEITLGAIAAIANVNANKPQHKKSMESYLLSLGKSSPSFFNRSYSELEEFVND